MTKRIKNKENTLHVVLDYNNNALIKISSDEKVSRIAEA